MRIDELLNKINIKQDIKPIPELKIGDGKELKKAEFKLGWKKFNITIRW